jgi:hypothetical protein
MLATRPGQGPTYSAGHSRSLDGGLGSRVRLARVQERGGSETCAWRGPGATPALSLASRGVEGIRRAGGRGRHSEGGNNGN